MVFALVRYSLGTNVNTPLCQVPTLEFGHGPRGARVQGLQGVDLVLGHISGHWVPVCTQFLLVSGSPLLCSRCYKVHVSKWRLTRRNGVTMYTVKISGTESVNTTPFCASTQALVPNHQVWISPLVILTEDTLL